MLTPLAIGMRKRAHLTDPAERYPGELALFYYAFAWRARPHIPGAARPFTLHKRSGFGDKLVFIGLAAFFEILPVHLLLHRKSPIAAWVLTALSLYGVLWLIAFLRSLTLRPCLVGADEAIVRLGLFFTLRIPARAIARIVSEPTPGALVLPRGATPGLCIEFTEPLEAQLIFGLRKRVTALALAADDPETLTAALRLMAY